MAGVLLKPGGASPIRQALMHRPELAAAWGATVATVAHPGVQPNPHALSGRQCTLISRACLFVYGYRLAGLTPFSGRPLTAGASFLRHFVDKFRGDAYCIRYVS